MAHSIWWGFGGAGKIPNKAPLTTIGCIEYTYSGAISFVYYGNTGVCASLVITNNYA